MMVLLSLRGCYNQITFDYIHKMIKGRAVYIMTNQHDTVLYTGVTSNLIKRIQEHKEELHPNSFTAKYNIDKLVYYERYHSITEAIDREKEIKKYRREKKDNLINGMNPQWLNLFDTLD